MAAGALTCCHGFLKRSWARICNLCNQLVGAISKSNTMDPFTETRRRLDEQVISFIKPCFQPDAFDFIAGAIRFAETPQGVERAILGPLNSSVELHSHPVSTEDFINKTTYLFSTSFAQHLQERYDDLDSIGGMSVTAAFWPERSIHDWCGYIINETLMAYYRQAQKKEGMKGMPGYQDLQVNMMRLGNDIPSTQPPNVVQIALKGELLSTAWQNNPQVRALTAHEQVVQSTWTPTVTGSLPVYHGTVRHLPGERFADQLLHDLESAPIQLRRSPGVTQLYPQTYPSVQLQSIFTSFSALRAVLWAVFRGVPQDPPGANETETLRRDFRLGGRWYRGVVLVESFPSQSLQGLSKYTIPTGKEDEWSQVAATWSLPSITWDAWRAIHGMQSQDGSFPDVLQGREVSQTRGQMSGWPCNKALLWQTAWMSQKAADQLNRNVSTIYVVSFERTAQEPAQPSNGTSKLPTLTHNIGRYLKAATEKA